MTAAVATDALPDPAVTARLIRQATATILFGYAAALNPANTLLADDIPGRLPKGGPLRLLVAAHITEARAEAKAAIMRAYRIVMAHPDVAPGTDSVSFAAKAIGRHAQPYAEAEPDHAYDLALELEDHAERIMVIVQPPRRPTRFDLGPCPEWIVGDDGSLRRCDAPMVATIDANPIIECDSTDRHRWIPHQWNRLYHKVRSRR